MTFRFKKKIDNKDVNVDDNWRSNVFYLLFLLKHSSNIFLKNCGWGNTVSLNNFFHNFSYFLIVNDFKTKTNDLSQKLNCGGSSRSSRNISRDITCEQNRHTKPCTSPRAVNFLLVFSYYPLPFWSIIIIIIYFALFIKKIVLNISDRAYIDLCLDSVDTESMTFDDSVSHLCNHQTVLII